MDNGTIVVIMIFGALVSFRLAANKHRNAIGWLFIGAGFPVISLIALLCLPALAAPPSPPAPMCPRCAGPLATL